MEVENFSNARVVVMGLGLNGGGLASARFFVNQGARVTVTDLRDEKTLDPTLKELSGLDIRYVLGKHRLEDFKKADLVVKNPGVPRDSPYLQEAKRVETDLSLFLSRCPNPLLAVTGSKGKSSVVSALHHILRSVYPDAKMGGNITLSPLSFINDLALDTVVVLELSSWQLGDLRNRDLLHPQIAVITNILRDHQNMYKKFEDYVEDKAEIFKGLSPQGYSIFYQDTWGEAFKKASPGRTLFYGPKGSSLYLESKEGYFQNPITGTLEKMLPQELATPGRPFRQNCLLAAAVARLYGLSLGQIQKALGTYSGLTHRLELVRVYQGISYYNDTTATIPDAMAAGIKSFDRPVHLICGGNDKELDLSPLGEALGQARSIHLLEGTATDKFLAILQGQNLPFYGPFPSLKGAFDSARSKAKREEVILFSPGATSFGMFVNEFQRGEMFRHLVEALGER